MKSKLQLSCLSFIMAIVGLLPVSTASNNPSQQLSLVTSGEKTEAVAHVNPYMGNISHLLVPTYPTVHLPASLLRVHPIRADYTTSQIGGLPVSITGHRRGSQLKLGILQGNIPLSNTAPVYSYDNETVKPYYYSVDLDEMDVNVQFAPSHQSAIYQFTLTGNDSPTLFMNVDGGELASQANTIWGYQRVGPGTNMYVYLESDIAPTQQKVLTAEKGNTTAALIFPVGTKTIKARYGISLISVEQAKKNLRREIGDYDLGAVAGKGREIWNKALGKIDVSTTDQGALAVFYTSLYRIFERPVCISEDGHYYSPYDNKVHSDQGRPFYTDDWLWDTYRAAHPLRVLIEPQMEQDILNSYVNMSYESADNHWMPTFPGISGDSRGMNSNHAVASVLDAYVKGLRGFDLEKAYTAAKAAITEKTLIPWSAAKAGELDRFYAENGYFPALAVGEAETVSAVSRWEKRQPVAVTLGTVYDEWCLAQIARALGKTDDYNYFIGRSLNYRKIYNAQTKFFHPKDKDGKFIEPFDYALSGGQGARDAYDENNGWVYKWDVPHNVGDLVELMGGPREFSAQLELMYNTPIQGNKFEFYYQLPDHTGNVGQFSMANEPSLHIPYLYNYAGEPWKTQKRVRNLLSQWFRNDLMGVPGDEDGGGMSSFVVFSSLGFYPVTPGLPMYAIGSPVFSHAKIDLGAGKTFEVVCTNFSPSNKYIQSAKLNGKVWDKSWIPHTEIASGGKIEFVMGPNPNKNWAVGPDSVPPSFTM